MAHDEDNDYIDPVGEASYPKKFSVAGPIYTPINESANFLPAGIYLCKRDYHENLMFERQPGFLTTKIIRFKDTAGDKIVDEIHAFWGKLAEYQERDESHKRGYLLYGPPGGGKTSLVTLLIEQFIKDGNLVFYFNRFMIDGLKLLRQMDPERKLMVVIEDIDGFIQDDALEQQLLQFLDGSLQLVNTIVIATTNFPEDLPSRIRNRPSRFDRLEYIGYPNEVMRAEYISQKAKHLEDGDLEVWVDITKGMSLAHIKELILAVEVYEVPFEEALQRIKDMMKENDNSEDFDKKEGRKEGLGFDSGKNKLVNLPPSIKRKLKELGITTKK